MASDMARGHFRTSGFSSVTAAVSTLDKTKIAELPVRFISDMSREELIRLIRAAQLPLVDARTLPRLPYLDRAALERLAHLARRCCRSWRSSLGRVEPEKSPVDRRDDEADWEDM